MLREEPDLTKIGIWKVEESIEELRSKLILNNEEISFYNSLNKGKRNIHWLSSRVLLRNMLNTDHFIEIKGDEHGKPHLINFDMEISITHSADYAAVIISKSKVGIDIEKIKPVIANIAPKFMNKTELGAIYDVKKEFEKLYVYWCTKESIFKLNGKQHLHFKDNILIEPFEYKNEGWITAKIVNYEIENVFRVKYEKFRGYMFTYVILN